MRKIFKSFMLVAAAAMAYTSCQKEETAAPETVSATLTMHAGVEETKTYLDENNAVLWGKGEAVTLYVGAGETAKFFDSASTDAYDGKASASFTFAIENVDPADSYALGGIYPASAAMDDNKNAAQYKVILPATQNQVDGNYDPSAYIMVLKPEVVTELPAEYTASFRRAVALNKITLTGVKENISSVEITVEPSQEGLYLAGRRYVDLTTAEFGKIYYDQTNTVTVNAPYTGSSIDVWFTSWGMDLKSGDKLTVKMTSATKTYTRKITANENGIKFVEGDLNTLKINMASAEEETTGLLENGDYLIAGVFSNNVYVATAYVSGNNLKSVQVTVSDNKIPEVEGLSNCKMTITKITEGDYAGMYTITDVNGKYLYAASNSGNQLKSREEPDVNSYWTIKPEDDGTYSIVASKSTNRNVMQMNPNDNNPLFSCYATLDLSKYQRVILYPYSMIVPDTTPKLEMGEESIELTAAGGEGTIAVTAKNLPADIQVRALTAEGAQEEVEWLTASYADGVITYTAEANESTEARTAYIEVYVSDELKTGVSVTQAAAGATKQYYVKVTTAPNDWSGTYLMVCDSKKMVLSDISTTSTKYGIGSEVEIADNKIEATETLASYQVVLSPGSTSGSYLMTFKGSYLYWSSGNSLATNANNNSNTNWFLSVSDGDVTIKNCKDNTRVIRWNASSPRFACYTSGQTAIQLYKLEDGNAGGETPEPDPEEPSTGVSKTAEITFGNNGVKIDAASVTGTDSENNNWTITTVGTTSYTSSTYYHQVGSSSKPATSITFTTTLPSTASVSGIEAKFGGFSGTAGDITLKVGDTSVGTGKLNATSDVTVKSTSTASGNKVTVTITNIAKGVKCYYISVNYTE